MSSYKVVCVDCRSEHISYGARFGDPWGHTREQAETLCRYADSIARIEALVTHERTPGFFNLRGGPMEIDVAWFGQHDGHELGVMSEEENVSDAVSRLAEAVSKPPSTKRSP